MNPGFAISILEKTVFSLLSPCKIISAICKGGFDSLEANIKGRFVARSPCFSSFGLSTITGGISCSFSISSSPNFFKTEIKRSSSIFFTFSSWNSHVCFRGFSISGFQRSACPSLYFQLPFQQWGVRSEILHILSDL